MFKIASKNTFWDRLSSSNILIFQTLILSTKGRKSQVPPSSTTQAHTTTTTNSKSDNNNATFTVPLQRPSNLAETRREPETRATSYTRWTPTRAAETLTILSAMVATAGRHLRITSLLPPSEEEHSLDFRMGQRKRRRIRVSTRCHLHSTARHCC